MASHNPEQVHVQAECGVRVCAFSYSTVKHNSHVGKMQKKINNARCHGIPPIHPEMIDSSRIPLCALSVCLSLSPSLSLSRIRKLHIVKSAGIVALCYCITVIVCCCLVWMLWKL